MSLLRIRLAAGALAGAFLAIGKPIFSQSLPMFTGARQ